MNKGQFISFPDYFEHCFVPFEKLSLPVTPDHRQVCTVLQKAVLGELPGIELLVINIAPRIGKTKILEALVTWLIAYFPDQQSIYTSYSSVLAEKSTKYIQQILNSKWYTKLFPWFKGLGATQRSNDFDLAEGGRVYSSGVGGTITGFGAGLKRRAGGFIAIDDPSKPDDALSEAMAEMINFWFENTILRRRNSDKFCPVIVVQQRLAPNDLSGHILEKYKEKTLHIIVDAEDANGESRFVDTFNTTTLKKLKEVSPFVYWAQYRQRPIMLGGNLIKTDDFMLYDEDVSGWRWDKKTIVCDTALKADEQNDNSVIQCWGGTVGKAYLIEQVMGKWESPELVTNFRAFYNKHHMDQSPVTRVTVEDKAAGTGLGQTLRREGIPVEPIPRNKDKVTRVQEILPFIVTHMVYIPKNQPWVPGFLTECAQFRKDGKQPNDDQVDSMCDGIQMTLGRPLSILDVLAAQMSGNAA